MPSSTKLNQESKSAKLSGPQIHLSSGGGMLKGMGESFEANSFSGAASLEIPIHCSPCRGFEPLVSINYNSNAGNSIFGLGFSISLSSITRRTEQSIPMYDDSDIFMLDGGKILVRIKGSESQKIINNEIFKVTRFQPRFESEFEKIEFWESQINLKKTFWRVFDGSNIASIYGQSDQAKIVDPNHTSHIYSWLLEVVYDAKGNAQYYYYKPENSENVPNLIYENNRTQNANKYPEKICYGNYTPFAPTSECDIAHVTDLSWHFAVVFDYGEYNVVATNDHIYNTSQAWLARKDPFSNYKTGFEIRTHRLCRNLLMFHLFEDEFGNEPILTRSTRFVYEENPTGSQLKSTQTIGWRYYGNRISGKRYLTESLPPLELEYVVFNPSKSTFEKLSDKRGFPLPAFSGPGSSSFVDLYQEGVPGVLNQQGGSFSFFSPGENTRGVEYLLTYNPLPDPSSIPSAITRNNPFTAFADVNADGRQELLSARPFEAGYYSSNRDRTWSNFTPFAAFPTDYHFSKNQELDVSGLGRSDVILLCEDFTHFYASKGYEGYGLPQSRARYYGLPSNGIESKTEAILFVDILGSGQQHQVRITNGKIECWPNLGYGEFGEKIELGNVPYLDDFDTNRIHLANIDGSGTLDLIYAYPDKIDVYINQSGNSFASVPITIYFPVNYYSPEQISFLDVYGNGNCCLVFTEDNPSPNQWVYDFCGVNKPYLLCTITNNLGASTNITYASSTQFYLEDKLLGSPWITSLPYPIQLVQKVIYEDQISQNKLVNTFTYHHGYYDFIEREFRGFGRIERLDVETASQSNNAHKNKNFLNDDGQYVASSLTKIWYHTGAWELPKPLTEYFKEEYFQGDSKAYPMPDPVFDWGQKNPDSLTQIQAFTALQGETLRTEIYGFDGPKVETVPYAVNQSNYEVKLLHSKDDLPFAVFHTFERESIDYDYELNANDPNVSHGFTLAIDNYGNVTQSCNIYYPRRSPESKEVTYPDQQLILRVDYTVVSYYAPVDDFDNYFFGLVQETKDYEITQLNQPPVLGIYFNFDNVATQIGQAINNPALIGPTANLLTWHKLHYLHDNTQKIAPQILLVNSEEAVFSDSLISNLFKGKTIPGGLANFLVEQNGYYFDTNNKYWWKLGNKLTYSDAKSFYSITNVEDPFYARKTGRSGSVTSYVYDKYQLLLKSVSIQGRDNDVLPSKSTILKMDYRTLTACKIQDDNEIISEILQSPLGVVIVASHYGSEYQDGLIKPLGFTPLPLDGETDWPIPASIDEVVNNPEKFLQGAATFFYYDFFDWINRKQPIYWVNLTAEQYPNPISPNIPVGDIPIALQFSDGFGRIIQSKQKVEAGEAFLFDNQGNPIIGSDGKIKQGNTNPRWVNSGRVRYNNKGSPFQQYEPYFTSTYYFIDNQELNTFGVSKTLFYDPIDRVVSIIRPKEDFKNAFFSKVVYTSWSQIAYDDNDTIKDSPYYQYYITAGKGELPPYEKDALLKAAHFYNTPTTHIFDNRGNNIQTISTLEDGSSQSIYSGYDILSRVIWSADSRLYAAGIKNFEYTYDMLGTGLHSVSVDAGESYVLHDPFEQPIYYTDSRGFIITRVYDSLARLVQIYVQGGDGSPQLKQTTERIIYGDSLDSEGNTIYPDLTGRNIRGKICVSYDQALRQEIPYFTIRGNPITLLRQLRISYQNEANWNVTLPNNWIWQDLFNLLNSKDIDISKVPFFDKFKYDALGRISSTLDADQNSIQYQYYISGLLSQVVGLSKEGVPYAYAGNLSYNARGNRRQITYANVPNQALLNINYTYDPDNFNLINILTERLSDKFILQNLNYYYDPTNNITHIENLVPNLALRSINTDALDEVKNTVTPDLDYTYDAFYRLIQSQGRAIAGYSAADEEEGSYQPYFPTVQQENYLMNYTYDKDGGNNLIGVQYNVNNATRWSRSLTLSSQSNRAVEFQPLGPHNSNIDPIDKYFDENGNQIKMGPSTSSTSFTWNYRNNIESITLKQNKTQYFVYNSSGKRIRVISQSQPSADLIQIEESIYLGHLIIRRTYQNQVLTEEFHKIRLFDNKVCVAEKLLWLLGNPPSDVTSPQVRFQLGNYQDSSMLEIDTESKPISYEEYLPFGGTTYALASSLEAINLKDYRYAKEERDKDSGFYYYGARYYSPWLGRWLSPDPIGSVGGFNLYAFVGNNPIMYTDIGGFAKTRGGRGGRGRGRGRGRGIGKGGIGRGGRGGMIPLRGGIGRGGRGGRGRGRGGAIRGGRGGRGGAIVPRVKAPGTLTVATFNVTGTESAKTGPSVLNHLTTMIQTETPDLVALQEMNSTSRTKFEAELTATGIGAQYSQVHATEFPPGSGGTGKTNTILFKNSTIASVTYNRRIPYNMPTPTSFAPGHFTGERQRAPVAFTVTTVAPIGTLPNTLELITVHAPLGVPQGNDFFFAREGMRNLGRNALSSASVTTPTIFALDSNLSQGTLSNALGGTFPVHTHQNLDAIMATPHFNLTHTTHGGTQFGPSGSKGHDSLIADFQ